MRRIVEHVDVLVGNEEDLQMGLGIPGPEVAATSKLDPSTFFGMIDRVTQKFPRIKVVATTLREVPGFSEAHIGRALAAAVTLLAVVPALVLRTRNPGVAAGATAADFAHCLQQARWSSR